jgi:hypothetical protein
MTREQIIANLTALQNADAAKPAQAQPAPAQAPAPAAVNPEQDRIKELQASIKADEEKANQDRISELQTSIRADMSQRGQRQGQLEWDAEKNASQWTKAGTAISDMANAGLHGITFGFDDKAAAALHAAAGKIGLADNVGYDKALEQERYNTARRQGRMEAIMPGSPAVFEGLGSLAIPAGGVEALGARYAPAVMAKLGKLASPIANILENAGYGALSGYGHDQNVGEGAVVGGSGATVPIAAAAAKKYGPSSMRDLGAGWGAEIGNQLLGSFGETYGSKYGGMIGSGIGTAGGAMLNYAPTRALLSLLMRAPGRLYGQVSENMQNQ